MMSSRLHCEHYLAFGERDIRENGTETLRTIPNDEMRLHVN